MASDIPATSEAILQTDPSKQFLDTFIGQGWDKWGEGLAAQTRLNSCSSFSARSIWWLLPVFRHCSSGSWLSLWPEQRTRERHLEKDSARSGCLCACVGAMGALAPHILKDYPFSDCHSRMYRFFGKSRKLYLGGAGRGLFHLSMAARFRFRPLTRMLPNIPRLPRLTGIAHASILPQ